MARVPGIGPKGAGALLARFGSLEEIYRRLDEVPDLGIRGAVRLARLLSEHEAQVWLARRLTGIVEDVELSLDPTDLRPRAVDVGALMDWCTESGIGRAVRRRLAGALEARTDDSGRL